MPPGSQAILISRPAPPAIPVPTDTNYGKHLIRNNFSLLGFQIGV